MNLQENFGEILGQAFDVEKEGVKKNNSYSVMQIIIHLSKKVLPLQNCKA